MFILHSLFHTHFHPSLSLLRFSSLTTPINLFHKDSPPPSQPPILHLSLSLFHTTLLRSLYFTYCTPLPTMLDNFSLLFRHFHFTGHRFFTIFDDFPHTLLPFKFCSIITFLNLFLKVICLQGRIPNTSARNWFQCWLFLFTKEYFPISVLCLLLLIFLS